MARDVTTRPIHPCRTFTHLPPSCRCHCLARYAGHLAADYDTAWARTGWARAVRFCDARTHHPATVKFVAHPRLVSRDRIDSLGFTRDICHQSLEPTSIPAWCCRRCASCSRQNGRRRRFRLFLRQTLEGCVVVGCGWVLFHWSETSQPSVHRHRRKPVERRLEPGLVSEGTRGEDDFTIPFKPGGAFLSIRTASL